MLHSVSYTFGPQILWISVNKVCRSELLDEQNRIKCSATVSVIKLHFGQTVKYLRENSFLVLLVQFAIKTAVLYNLINKMIVL